MKKRMIILLLGMIWLFAACGKGGSDREIPGSEAQGQDLQNHLESQSTDRAAEAGTGREKEAAQKDGEGRDSAVKEAVQKESAVGNADNKGEPGMENWKNSYLEYLTGLEYGDEWTYSLIYVDGDEIPELVIDTGVEATGCQILTWHEGRLAVLQTSRLYFTYIEKGNLLCNSEGNMGYYYDDVYALRDGQWEYIGGGTLHDADGIQQFDENGDWIFEYHWMEQPVDKAEYEEKLHAIYPEKQGVTPEIYYIKDEMESLLKTGETMSAKHRYELIIEDMTWMEARRACEERGGYLATLTSREEFERIQAQIIAEEKMSVTFFVGAGNPENAWGFTWFEPETGKEYPMISLYNALFADYWLEGEPSYTGKTETGEEVREDCVAMFYRSAEGRCYFNDVPNDILSAAPSFAGRIGYICEYGEIQ